ncbi:pyridoxamine 5'-phosphate oxidase family protein [Desulfosarcina sp.]|uniref:pyridoxamine 5'-phosphate oxidase family protein n=1 Tax=Desulfosarcina sp. TaxID=2027861 RepID=UPI00356557CE
MATGAKSTPEDGREAALALIQRESTLTLATAGESGPWSAPVYYVCLKGRFYFFSSPQSRHIQQAVKSGEAAASVFQSADSWQAIRGIQMTGTLERVDSIALSIKVIAAYLKRFSFTREFFPDDPAPDLAAFFTRFKARLYAFTPTAVYYIDNRFGFGARQRIDWQ